jgi:stress response protein YsnF
MFDRLAKMIAPEVPAGDRGYLVTTQVAPERIDVAARALEAGAERVEIAPPPRLDEHVVELSETVEELVIEKEAVLREEIVMRVQAKEHVQHVHDTVRRTEVEVERFGPGEESRG